MMSDTDPSNSGPFEIIATDFKSDDTYKSSVAESGEMAFILRNQPVILAATVAQIFSVETREIVQNIKSNPDFFPEKYAFQLVMAEVDTLRSAGLISKSGRGGSRALPWAVTRKGTFRLAMIMKSARAIQVTDTLIDIFDTIVSQIGAGAGQIRINNPIQIAPTAHYERAQQERRFAGIREKLIHAVEALLETVIDERHNTTVADELQAMSSQAVNHIKAWLRGKSLDNNKLEAETMVIMEQARDMYERRQADLADKSLDRERRALENVLLKIKVIEQVIETYHKLEPTALVQLTTSFDLGGSRQLKGNDED